MTDDAVTSGLADPAKSANSAQAQAFRVNWCLNKNIRANPGFSRIFFDDFESRTMPRAVPAQPENVLF